jgi:lysophospholipase L1-like esterase
MKPDKNFFNYNKKVTYIISIKKGVLPMKKEKVKTVCMVLMLLVFCFGQAFAASCGDVNSSGGVDIVDALLIAQYYVGLYPSNFDSTVADVNGDASINIVDALRVAQYYVGLVSELSCSNTTSPPTAPPGSTTIKGSEVLVIGDSFIAMSHEITRNLEQLTRNAGILPSNESFRDNAVSGMRLSGGGSPTIPQQYSNGIQQGPVKWVVMDGGGNDCLQGSCSTPPTADCADLQNAVTAARNLLTQMGRDGVVKVIYFFYPEPQADFGGLKAKLDVLRPLIQNVVNSSTSPVCYWLDLRPVFQGRYGEYITSDGIHPTSAGCQATANAIWDVIQKNNFFSAN